MSAGKTPARIELPPLPDRTPDPSRGSTLRHYHHEPTWEVNDSTHDEYDTKSFSNPRYIMPSTASPWTGAEDSLLLENIPNNSLFGIGDTLVAGQEITWKEISRMMNFQSFERNISMRDYTEYSCQERYTAILERIEKGHHLSEFEDGHIGANPYATLIELGAPNQLPAYCGLEDELAGLKVHRGRRIIISGRGRGRLPGISGPMSTKRRVSQHVEGSRKRFKHWTELGNETSRSIGVWCTPVR